jgi:hypothetical protein
MKKLVHSLTMSADNTATSTIHDINLESTCVLVKAGNEDTTFDLLNVQDKVDNIKDKVFYRHPNLSLPRQKMELLKEKFNIKITRNIEKADYQIISQNYVSSLIEHSWNNLYSKEDVVKNLELYKVSFTDEAYSDFCSMLDNINDEEYISLVQRQYYNSYNLFMDSIRNGPKFSSYRYINPSNAKIVYQLINSTNLIYDDALNNIIYEDLHVMTKEEYENCKKMIKSNDPSNLSLTLELMANCNLNESFDFISMLFYYMHDKLKMAANWNNINVKTLRSTLSDFAPFNNTSSGFFYDRYLKMLIKNNQLTEFAFKETARYAFHNVVKKTMHLTDESVFKIDINALQINPEYIDALNKNKLFITPAKEEFVSF